MNTINNISCQPLQPKNHVSFKGREQQNEAPKISEADVADTVSSVVIDLADKGNKGTKTLGILAMLVGIGTGGYLVASKTAKGVLSSLSSNTKYLDKVSDKAVKLFQGFEQQAGKLEVGEDAGRIKKTVVGMVKGMPDKIRKFASKGMDEDNMRKAFSKNLTKGVADLTDEEMKGFPEWLEKTKALNLDTVKAQFAKEIKKNSDDIKPEDDAFISWVRGNTGIDLGVAKAEYASGFKKSVSDWNKDDLAAFSKYVERRTAKNGLIKVTGNAVGVGAGLKAVSGVSEDENGDKIPDKFQQETIKDQFSKAVGTMVLEGASNGFFG